MATITEIAPGAADKNTHSSNPENEYIALRRAENIPLAISLIEQAVAPFEFGKWQQDEYGNWHELQPKIGDILDSKLVGHLTVTPSKVSGRYVQYRLGASNSTLGVTTIGTRGSESIHANCVSCDLETLEVTSQAIEGRNLRYIMADLRAQSQREEQLKKYSEWRAEVLQRAAAEEEEAARKAAEDAYQEIERAAAD